MRSVTNRPNKFKIDAEVLVDNNIPERNDLGPRNVGVRLAHFRGNRATGFAEQRQTVQDRALDQIIVNERFPALFGKFRDQLRLFDSVEKTESIGPHSDTASRITSDARRGLSPRLATTSTLPPRAASRSSHKPVRSSRDRTGSKSTRKSKSETTRWLPHRTEPKTRIFQPPPF